MGSTYGSRAPQLMLWWRCGLWCQSRYGPVEHRANSIVGRWNIGPVELCRWNIGPERRIEEAALDGARYGLRASLQRTASLEEMQGWGLV